MLSAWSFVGGLYGVPTFTRFKALLKFFRSEVEKSKNMSLNLFMKVFETAQHSIHLKVGIKKNGSKMLCPFPSN